MKKVFITGIDGYLGWTLAVDLMTNGYSVAGCDNLMRRAIVIEVGGTSAIPINPLRERIAALEKQTGGKFSSTFQYDCRNAKALRSELAAFNPDVIVHLGQMPSAPYSMIDAEHAINTHENNVSGFLNVMFAVKKICPEAHIVKLGTMGEYGTPNVDIPEGYFEMEFRGRKQETMFPRDPGSWYHLTKVHDTHNARFACRLWGLRVTDIMQGVVYGTQIDEMADNDALRTRFDFDECFGTALNRFCAQAVAGEPLTPYGVGNQTRGYLPLRDSIQCMKLAIENAPDVGECRVFNQFDETYSVNELAAITQEVGNGMGLEVDIANVSNPRMEAEDHYYNPDHAILGELGYIPSGDMKAEIKIMLDDLIPHRDIIIERKSVLYPRTNWR